MTEQKSQLQSICELSNHLLYLEPIFSGVAIREELTRFKAQFQKLVLDLFSQLEMQVSDVEPLVNLYRYDNVYVLCISAFL